MQSDKHCAGGNSSFPPPPSCACSQSPHCHEGPGLCPPGPQGPPCRASPAPASVIADFPLHPEFHGVPVVSSLSGSHCMAARPLHTGGQRPVPAVWQQQPVWVREAACGPSPGPGQTRHWSGPASPAARPRPEPHQPRQAVGPRGQPTPARGL